MEIGVDIEDVARFSKLDREKDSSFLNKIFTKKELDYCFSKKSYGENLAARFCAKEATIKALNNLGQRNIAHNSIEIQNRPDGSPVVNFKNQELKRMNVKLSLSHCADKALAFVVIE